MKLSYEALMGSILDLRRTGILTEARFHQAIDGLNQRHGNSKQDMAEQRRQLVKEISGLARSIERLLDAIEDGQATPALKERLLTRKREKAQKEAPSRT